MSIAINFVNKYLIKLPNTPSLIPSPPAYGVRQVGKAPIIVLSFPLHENEETSERFNQHELL